MIDLLALVPNATGEVEFVENNAWVLRNLKKGKIDVPAGPLVSFTLEEGINLGNTFSLTNKFGFDASSPPVLTMRGVELLGGVISPGTPTGHWCEILVTNIDTGEKGKYVALAGTGASLTALPAVAERLGVEAGGHTNTLTAMGMKRSMCGAVQVQLLRIAYPQGLDRTTGVQIHSYKELSEDVRASIKQTNPVVATQMESEVPLIGLNLLGAWGLAVDPHLGVVPSQNKP